MCVEQNSSPSTQQEAGAVAELAPSLPKAPVVALSTFRAARTQDQNTKLYNNIFESIKHIG